MSLKTKKKLNLSAFQTIILGFIVVLFVGAFLLMLPISSKDRSVTPFVDALFTATSSLCVTGLVTLDTATHWSIFGKIILIILIQIGGLGVVSIASSFVMLSKRKISLKQRSSMQEALSSFEIGGIASLLGLILKITFAVEFIGAIALMPTLIKDYGYRGIFMAFFTSISAFCNAGFDLFGTEANKFQSLTKYTYNAYFNIIIMLLIVLGGIGFMTWNDFKTHKFKIKRYRLQSKIILITSAILIFIPAIIFFFTEYSDLPLGKRILNSMFQSVTTRTAGFNTTDLTKLSGTGYALFIILMLIGGAPGSTAGGLKMTTIAVLVINAWSTFKRKDAPEALGRRIPKDVITNAATILLMYMFLCCFTAIALSLIENLPINLTLFEAASAIGTVGLTLGITPSLHTASKIILLIMMFLGRVGGLTLIYAAVSNKNSNLSKLPEERVMVG